MMKEASVTLRKQAKIGDKLWTQIGCSRNRSTPVRFRLATVVKVGREWLHLDDRDCYRIDSGIRGWDRGSDGWCGGNGDLVDRMADFERHRICDAVMRCDAATLRQIAALVGHEIPKANIIE